CAEESDRDDENSRAGFLHFPPPDHFNWWNKPIILLRPRSGRIEHESFWRRLHGAVIHEAGLNKAHRIPRKPVNTRLYRHDGHGQGLKSSARWKCSRCLSMRLYRDTFE